jgi:hypothetical protein
MRNPNLATIEMVENFIQKHSGEYNKTQVWKKLPKQMMYQTYKRIIDYLIKSNKVITDRDGKLLWIFDSKLIKRKTKEPGMGEPVSREAAAVYGDNRHYSSTENSLCKDCSKKYLGAKKRHILIGGKEMLK